MPAQQHKDTQTQYIERGSGAEAVVFVHGFVASRRWWQPAIDWLPDNFHAYALDLRAMASEDPAAPDHTIAQYAADLHDFVEAMGLDNFHLVGHSLGGGVAMLYALEHQERLKSLLLVDPLAPFGTKLLDPTAAEWVNAQYGNREGIERSGPRRLRNPTDRRLSRAVDRRRDGLEQRGLSRHDGRYGPLRHHRPAGGTEGADPGDVGR